MAAESMPNTGEVADFEHLYARGREVFAELIPGGRERLDKIFALAPDLARTAVGTVYGHLHDRQALDARTREIAALAAIVASGMCGTPLAVHVRTALAAGVAPAEIVEVVLECAAFGGFPRAVSALPVIEEAFGQAGIPVPPRPSARDTVLRAIDTARNRAATDLPETADESWAAPLCEPGTDTAVHAVAPDQVLVVAVPKDSHRPEAVLHIRAVEDRIVEVTTLSRAGDLAGVDRAAPVPGPSARQALGRLLEDLRTVGHGPAAELVITDPDLLDETAPLRDVLAAGIRPEVAAIDAHTAIAVFRDPRNPHPVVALAFADDDRIRHVRVIQAEDASPVSPGS
ncbi:carboxymuconolactone decarboxylase family protein [Streptomyces sp. L2]|uniref:carboxymuconolactone decarboxylase family protein n=1 Tax=Streptomyces sp. L2 TaxID=2162665 RepID=UPI0019D6DE4C|nr:carboxymuconolactone decarboxylase family protein [Streptomyces sp. L2]